MLPDSTNLRVIADNIKKLDATTQANTEAIETGRDYSKTEFDTGQTWIDGKTIYCKVFEVAAFPNNTTNNINHEVTNLGTVIELRGMGVDTDGAGLPIEFRNLLYLRFSSTQISVASTTDYSAYSGYIIFKYTKAPTP